MFPARDRQHPRSARCRRSPAHPPSTARSPCRRRSNRRARACVRPILSRSRAALIAACASMNRAAALFLHALGDRIGQRVGGCAFDRRVGEAADAVELRLVAGTSAARRTRRRFRPGNPTMNVLRNVMSGRAARHARDAVAALSPARRAASSAAGCAGSRAGTARRDRAGGRRRAGDVVISGTMSSTCGYG